VTIDNTVVIRAGRLGVAISERSTDLWQHVQRRAWEDAAVLEEPTLLRTLPFPVTPSVQICAEEHGWTSERYRERADAAFVRMEQAIGSGRFRKATACRAAFLHNVHLDRLARARSVARENGLRLDPMGRGPVPELPTVHYRDRLPWGLVPLAAHDHDDLPDRACSVVRAWNGQGDVFDRYVLADEPPGVAPFPTHCLIGAISADGRVADWFVLDRWAS
jgi:hypothetical protein